jgi:rhamnosyltransferase
MRSCSVIIPTLDAGNLLEPLVASLRRQTCAPDEIIVIDSSSTDDTAGQAVRLGCRLLTTPRESFNHGKTRNTAAQTATGEALVFLTQDALPVNDRFLEELLKPLRHGVAAAFARQVAYPGARPTEVFARSFNYPPQSSTRTGKDLQQFGIRTYFFSNVASAIRKDIFLEMGMFPDNVIMNEDMLFCSTLIEGGHTVMYAADAAVYHSHDYSTAQTFQRYFDIGAFYAAYFANSSSLNITTTGASYTRQLLGYLLREKMYRHIPFFIMETFAKFIGFHVGRMHNFLPLAFKRKLSLHRFFWK